ncbi:MAG: HAMP domain-containing histidine kinase [Lachnospiraceae bacterium]|nr:HAMP domain-containing histidine kinase [Lachnospiraceae bacterium]
MFQKVHLRLTFLCTGITAVIMIIMSLCYLYVSETGLRRNQFQAFRNDINTISTNLEQQTVISMEWLSKMEAQGNYLFFVLDNGTPFLFNQLNDPEENALRSLLLQESRDAFQSQSHTETSIRTSSQTTAFSNLTHAEYEFVSPSTNIGYFAGRICMGTDESALEIVVLSSMLNLENQIHEQRLRFLLIDLAAVTLLGIFSWFFTGWLLKPIAENQRKQAQFIASASHELRTPLSVILSAAECCRTAPPERREKFLKTISVEGMRVSSLVSDMLTLSQSDDHRFPIRTKPTELDTLLMNSYEAFVPLTQEKSISLSMELPDDALPPCNADPERVSQVISILLHNAISYTPEHGRITLSLAVHRDKFHITVTDNGIGISDEDKKKIFDRFYRAEKSRSTKDHFGLGLSIAYEIVKAHGGSIAVSDAEGGGSCFTVVL